MLQISSSAAKEIKRIQQNRQQPDALVKLAIISGGCSGLFYKLRIENFTKNSKDDLENNDDISLEINDLHVLVDRESWQYVENLKIDYAEDLMGGGFRFNNPQVKEVCGCGMSFSKRSK